MKHLISYTISCTYRPMLLIRTLGKPDTCGGQSFPEGPVSRKELYARSTKYIVRLIPREDRSPNGREHCSDQSHQVSFPLSCASEPCNKGLAKLVRRCKAIAATANIKVSLEYDLLRIEGKEMNEYSHPFQNLHPSSGKIRFPP